MIGQGIADSAIPFFVCLFRPDIGSGGLNNESFSNLQEEKT